MRASVSTSIAIIAVLWAYTGGTSAAAQGVDAGLIIGYRHFETDELEFIHNTHRDDGILPGAGVPGSAGRTSVESSDWLMIGGRFQKKTTGLSAFTLDLGALIGSQSANSDRRQNANDFRPSNEGSFIYTKAKAGAAAAAGYSYKIGRLLVGGESQVAAIQLENGWERFGKDQVDKKDFAYLFSIGPKVGFLLRDRGTIEAGLQFGHTTVASLSFAASF